jgi:hypothetical protein
VDFEQAPFPIKEEKRKCDLVIRPSYVPYYTWPIEKPKFFLITNSEAVVKVINMQRFLVWAVFGQEQHVAFGCLHLEVNDEPGNARLDHVCFEEQS